MRISVLQIPFGMTNLNVPQELIDLLVDNIHDDRRSLIKASLICRSWALATRPHLFRRAAFHIGFRPILHRYDRNDLDVLPSFYRFRLLDEIIQDRPSIAYSIHDVMISSDTNHQALLWNQSEPSITQILSRLHRVKSLTLRDIEWKCLSMQCRQSLVSIFSSPSLEHVDLHAFNVELSIAFTLLGSAKNLKSVRVAHTPTVVSYDNCYFEQPTERIALRSLELGPQVEQLALHMLEPESPIVISRLHHLRMTHVTDVAACGQLLRAAGKSLEILELWAPTSGLSFLFVTLFFI